MLDLSTVREHLADDGEPVDDESSQAREVDGGAEREAADRHSDAAPHSSDSPDQDAPAEGDSVIDIQVQDDGAPVGDDEIHEVTDGDADAQVIEVEEVDETPPADDAPVPEAEAEVDDDIHEIDDEPDTTPGVRQVSPFNLDDRVSLRKGPGEAAAGCFKEMDIDIGAQLNPNGEIASATAVIRLKMEKNNIGESCRELKGASGDAEISFGVTLKLPDDPAARRQAIDQFKADLVACFNEPLNGVKIEGAEASPLFQSGVVSAISNGSFMQRIWGKNFALKGENIADMAIGLPGTWSKNVLISDCNADGVQFQGKLFEVHVQGRERSPMSARKMVFEPELLEGRCTMRHVTAAQSRFAGDLGEMALLNCNIRGADLSRASGALVDFANDRHKAASKLDLTYYDEKTKWPREARQYLIHFEATNSVRLPSYLTTDPHRHREMSSTSFVTALQTSPVFSARLEGNDKLSVVLPSGEKGRIELKEFPTPTSSGGVDYPFVAQFVQTGRTRFEEPGDISVVQINPMPFDRFWDEFLRRVHDWETGRSDIDSITRFRRAVRERDEELERAAAA